jgi:malate dehydrogenase (oxaloacetate-decarboxylating)
MNSKKEGKDINFTSLIVSDGSAVLSYGNLGSNAVLPVLDGKCKIMQNLSGINAIPISLKTQNIEEIIRTLKTISPGLSGIMFEDIAAPKCFTIESKLENIGIPIFHDDQHGVSIATYAALTNAAKVVGKPFSSLRVCINGAGAAGNAIAKLLSNFTQENNVKSVREIIMCDSKGIIRSDIKNLRPDKFELARFTNKNHKKGGLTEAVENSDVLIGVSKGNCVKPEHIKIMADNPIVFALANPVPEISEKQAKLAGAEVVSTGRLDFNNSINNALVFPGMFKGAVDHKLSKFTTLMKYDAAMALAQMISEPTNTCLLPSIQNRSIPTIISTAIGETNQKANNNSPKTMELLTKSTITKYEYNHLLFRTQGRGQKYSGEIP